MRVLQGNLAGAEGQLIECIHGYRFVPGFRVDHLPVPGDIRGMIGAQPTCHFLDLVFHQVIETYVGDCIMFIDQPVEYIHKHRIRHFLATHGRNDRCRTGFGLGVRSGASLVHISCDARVSDNMDGTLVGGEEAFLVNRAPATGICES